MEITSAALCCFSPTRSTFNIATRLSGAMSLGVPFESINLTSVSAREKTHEFTPETLLLAGSPVYGGRLPRVEPGLFENLRGNGSPAVALVIYGGRAYDDALVELCDLLESRGFIPVAAGALVARHASSLKISAGRPDADDIEAIGRFGAAIKSKLSSGDPLSRPSVPGSRPYAGYQPKQPFAPITNEKCIYCMQCYRWCPTDAIAYYSPNETDQSRCVLCQGCVRRCPLGAREVTDEGFHKRVEGMEKALAGAHPEPEFFL